VNEGFSYKNHSIRIIAPTPPIEDYLLVTLLNISDKEERQTAKFLEEELLKYGELLDLRLNRKKHYCVVSNVTLLLHYHIVMLSLSLRK
jgi:hypothetical protein